MKKIFQLFYLLPMLAFGQTPNSNYIKTTTYKIPVTASLPTPTASQANQTITYFDGLGRPIQKRAYRESNTGKDIVMHIDYDAAGRQNKNYLPFVSQSASLDYSSAAASDVMTFYGSPSLALTGNPTFEATAYPYSEKLFEASPLNRVQKQSAPGETWKIPVAGDPEDHTIRIEKLANITSDAVKHFEAIAGSTTVNGYYPVTFSQGQNYSDGDLLKTIIKNENWVAGKANTTEEYRTKTGKVVLQRNFGESIVNEQSVFASHDTYYVYDQYGNLSLVIPPLSDGSAIQHNTLCFQYRYDKRDRLVEKKLPGKDWEFIVYDKSDNIIATGPSYSPFGNQSKGWLIAKYDIYGRSAYTGWYNGHQALTSADRNQMQNEADLSGTKFESRTSSGTTGYTNDSFPKESLQVLSINYYDNYSFPGAPAVLTYIESTAVETNVKGLQTGSWTRILTTEAESNGETASVFYDNKWRVLRNSNSNFTGGYTYTDISRTPFSGRINYAFTRHKRAVSDTEIIVKNFFLYSGNDKLLTHNLMINSDPAQIMGQYKYDELGRLITKGVGGTASPLQQIDYSYNIRGWLKGINNTDNLLKDGDPLDLFAFKINYNDIAGHVAGVEKLFNGNVAETYWRTSSDDILRKYGYKYDNLNRLKEAVYQKSGEQQNSYNESLSYDMNGNIKHLTRNGALDSQNQTVEIDNLAYTYDTTFSNRLMKVFDASAHPDGFKDDSTDGINDTETDYSYDDFGNLTKDQNKKIKEISYNHLNLPVKILFQDDRAIEYLYDAKGRKLQKKIGTVANTASTEYIDGFQYQRGLLQFFHTSEGYVNNTIINGTNNYSYAFNYTDHLGNIRMSFGLDPATNVLKIIEENHYYPFGLKHTNYNSASNRFQSIPESGAIALKAPVNPPGGGGGDPNADPSSVYKFKFNGQELQSEYSLNVTAMDYRQYDHAIGRFNGMDLLAELSPDTSPYRFANNNPNFWSDPSGLVDLDVVEVPIPDRSFSSFGGNTNLGASIPQFFSWGRGTSPDQGFPPLPSFLGVVSVNYDITKVTQQLEEVEIGVIKKKENSTESEDSDFSPWGPTLIGLGQPLGFLKPYGYAGSKPGSSIASWALSKTITYRSPLLKQTTRKVAAKIIGKQAAKKVGTAVVGRALGRLVPYVGWALLANDIYQNWEDVKGGLEAVKSGVETHSRLQENPETWVCFAKGTLVYTPNGLRPIEVINIGDITYSYNLEKQKIESSKVINTLNREVSNIYKIITNSEIIFVTAEHPIYIIDKGWIKVKELKAQDVLKSFDSKTKIEILKIEEINSPMTVYNIEVDSNHNYYITNSTILVHNKNITEIKKKPNPILKKQVHHERKNIQ